MRPRIAVGLALLLASACRPADDGLASYRLVAMATWVDLSLPHGATARQPGLIASIERELGRFERNYYAWGDGELAALNRALTETGHGEASDELAAVLSAAQEIARTTDRAFDPGVGPLVELWGFNSGERSDAETQGERSDAEATGERGDAGGASRGVSPDAGAIATALAASGSILDLVIDGTRIDVADGVGRRFTLDLGGIAKGVAVDRIVELLESRDIAPALVNAGGDLRVVGMRPDRPWRIGVAATRGDGVLGIIELEPGEAAFTSGDYERYFEQDGERLHHILDPRTGYPATRTQGLTVIAHDGTEADAAATALFVAGDDWREMARTLGIDAVLRVDAEGRIEMTAAMRERFQVGAEAGLDIIAAD